MSDQPPTREPAVERNERDRVAAVRDRAADERERAADQREIDAEIRASEQRRDAQ